MKLGILGGGKIVVDFLSMVHDIPAIKLSALLSSERSLVKNQELANDHGIEAVYTNIEELLASDIDTVYVALPNHLHFEFTKKALLAGKHVICEKPFTINATQLEDLAALALSKDLVLVEAITNQYFSNFEAIKKDIKLLGDIKIVEANYSQYSSRYDAFKNGEVLPAFDPKKAGGALMDINIYNLHLMVGLFGEPKSSHYYANVERGIDTSGMLILDYGNFKAVCIGSKDTDAPIKSTIQGRNGSIIIDGPTNSLEGYNLALRGETPENKDFRVHKHRMYQEFVEFENIISTHDMDKVKQGLDHSIIVMELVEEALQTAYLHLG
ncbi:MAG: NAD(P)-dependent oxidoreductase [Aerococcus viridans]|uniref:Gfo/Idh/MocA family oxidoreductase n=1 Tax=Aerococcus agrisoli TaxID=2487350 RepID=A0A3N4GG02_9LACT|nr:Gfo/Idh/MocA family oxidoreductase [Aerococcus agrisoli]OYW73738.1 MAG: NAD(P)-dependent oxidoreductase [Aerococcus viridans]RPA59596.1 gfo/Idh/MocA family oxidoreductase [Aerococcus agrisoli]